MKNKSNEVNWIQNTHPKECEWPVVVKAQLIFLPFCERSDSLDLNIIGCCLKYFFWYVSKSCHITKENS